MTLQKAKIGTFESRPYFLVEEALLNKSVVVRSIPKYVTVKRNGEQKLVIDIEIANKPKEYSDDVEDISERNESNLRVWFMNKTSSNKAIDLLGDNEEKWIDGKLPIEIITQAIDGKKKKVIYVEGAIEE